MAVKKNKVSDITRYTYVMAADRIGHMVADKQAAYGDSFGQAHKVMDVLYPKGVSKEQLKDFLTVVRVVDKLFRVANKKHAFEENPWQDIAGYALLEVCREGNNAPNR